MYFVLQEYLQVPVYILFSIKNWITGKCNSRVFIGLALMGDEPLYHTLQIWQACAWIFGAFLFQSGFL